MQKKIVLLSDGTGNSAAKLFKSNVWRTYQALDLSRGDQIACYNDGVGNSSFKPLAILGGAFGWGLKRNVLDLYLFLCRNYNAGDEIYCFGFSRGAFTIRILAGLIATQGIVTANSELELRNKALSAFRTFYSQHFKSALGVEKIGRWIRDLFTGDAGAHRQPQQAAKQAPDIRFVGLWDTVAAYGLPIDELTRAWSWIFPLSIPNRTPLPSVGLYCHALALDDERNTFHPVLLNESHPGPCNVKQVWFAGMHSNVGGGYPDDGLSYVPLEWMLTEASATGLRLKPSALAEVAQLKDPLGRLYDSRRGLGGFYRYQPRRMDWLLNDTSDPDNQVVIPRPKIHESVIHRIQKGVDRYAPIVLPREFDAVDTAGNVVTPHPELPSHAARRYEQQENIWDRVWWKRVAYFLSIGVSLALLAFPLYLPATEACQTASCVLSPMIRWASLVLPGFASPWLRAYESHPACFLGFVGLFVLLLKAGDSIQRRIHADMRALWGHVVVAGSAGTSLRPTGGFPYWLRTKGWYQTAFWIMKRGILPFAAGFAVLFVASLLLSRLLFLAGSSGGFICPGAEPTFVSPVRWNTASVCTASGFPATQGKTYVIELKITGDWKDENYKATVDGVTDPPKWMSLFALTRRSTRQPWFKPMLRIGDKGMDEYPLSGVVTDNGKRLIAEIKARREGQMYFYVNDAVLPGPANWQAFYKNNAGAAEVTIEEKKVP